jgi:hypothetical protein
VARLYLLDMISLLMSSGALFACAFLRRAFSATRQERRLSSIEETIRESNAQLDSLHASLARLRSRETMRENRQLKATSAEPQTKADLRRALLHGKTHAQIAAMHLTGVNRDA